MVWERGRVLLSKANFANRKVRRSIVAAACFGFVANAFLPKASVADENGVGFWLPGQFGSMAAVPQQAGWSAASIYYHTSLKASGEVAAAREASIGRFSRTVNVDLNVNLKARADLAFFNTTYVLPTQIFGGQLALGMTGAAGRNSTSLDGTLTASIGGLTATRSGSLSDSRSGFADLYPMATLRWNNGVHNYMTYLTGDIPLGSYDPTRLANFGIGHGAIDGGVGYTYFNPQTGYELSAVTGLTYNLRNPDTDYRNGVDWHLDWGASKFLSQQLFVGAVGYFYNQLTADSGALAILGDNKSSVAGIGPQVGYIFPVGNMQGYLNLKGYYEFDSDRRPSGWNTWLTFSISPAAPATPAVTRLVHK